MRKIVFVFLVMIVLSSACMPVAWPVNSQSTTTPPSMQQTATPAEVTVEASDTPSASSVLNLRLWVPPNMDPAADTPAGNLLKARLDQFSRQHDDLVIEVRVKSVSGPGGLLDSLAATSAAAPLALPDLVALPREGLEAAVLKGLVQTVESPENPIDDAGWYEYARQLIRVQNTAFGLPICGDALVMVYRPDVVSEPPLDWSAVLEQKTPFVFPAADQQAIFTLAQYQSLDTTLRDEEGRPYLEVDLLAQVLTFYSDAEERGVMPFWLTQYQDDQEVWDAFLEKRADLIVAWLSDYLAARPEETEFSVLPAANDETFTLADGWVWAVAAIKEDEREIAIELAKFLAERRFVDAYASSLGCITPFTNEVEAQTDSTQQAMVERVASSARLIPSTDILNSLGLVVQQAVMQVLKNQMDPTPAAQAAVDALTGP